MRVRFDGFILDTERKELVRGGAPLRLSPRAFRMLSFLVAQRPRAVSKRDLLDHIWAGSIVEEANLKTLVLEIRNALTERGGTTDAIRTVYGFGYAFSGEAIAEPDAGNEPLVRVEAQQRVVLLPEGVHVIGRNLGCAVFLDSASVSRLHARLHVGPTTLVLEDNASKNGTFLGGERVTTPVALPPRAHVRCGDVDVLVDRIGGPAAETVTVDPRV
ncbi:MAG TPA: winged helix-turn-helix domain-containing protein [Thermoanaerobaculia bacterium]